MAAAHGHRRRARSRTRLRGAADRYWDVNDTDPGLGGAGTWDLTNPIWGADNDGVAGPYSAWNNAALDNAIFTGTAGTVTLGAPITVHNLTFIVHNYIARTAAR